MNPAARVIATIAAASFLWGTGCSRLPWTRETINETNLAFSLRNNQPIILASIENRPAELIVGSAQKTTLLSTEYSRKHSLEGKETVSISFGERATARINPAVTDLKGMADGIVGADVWRRNTLIIDYFRGLATVGYKAAPMADLKVYPFNSIPTIPVMINGRNYQAIVDTASPDTAILPRSAFQAEQGRARVTLSIAGEPPSVVDVAVRDVSSVRIGSRLLSRFLVVIDYRTRRVGLWRDSRQPPPR